MDDKLFDNLHFALHKFIHCMWGIATATAFHMANNDTTFLFHFAAITAVLVHKVEFYTLFRLAAQAADKLYKLIIT